jgi:hypothetical protein
MRHALMLLIALLLTTLARFAYDIESKTQPNT